MKNLKLRCKQCGRGKLKNKFDKCYECRQSTHKQVGKQFIDICRIPNCKRCKYLKEEIGY